MGVFKKIGKGIVNIAKGGPSLTPHTKLTGEIDNAMNNPQSPYYGMPTRPTYESLTDPTTGQLKNIYSAGAFDPLKSQAEYEKQA